MPRADFDPIYDDPIESDTALATYASRLADFVVDRAPAIDQAVEVLCRDHVGTYVPPFVCAWTGEHWLNTSTGQALEAEVLGWRVAVPRATRSPA